MTCSANAELTFLESDLIVTEYLLDFLDVLYQRLEIVQLNYSLALAQCDFLQLVKFCGLPNAYSDNPHVFPLKKKKANSLIYF